MRSAGQHRTLPGDHVTDNSTVGRTVLDAERSVVVTGEAHHQDVLCELAPERGRCCCRVAIELVPIGPRLEARFDGQRVGELTLGPDSTPTATVSPASRARDAQAALSGRRGRP